jgi:drug/metabolite transporter (DMT)-like permease
MTQSQGAPNIRLSGVSVPSGPRLGSPPRGLWRMWLGALLWGLNWPIVKIMLATASPWTLRAAGLTGGAIFLLLLARLTKTSLAVPRPHWRTLVIASLLNVALFNICAVFAQLSMPTSRAAILTFTMPLWASLFAWALLGDKIDKRRALSLALGSFGLAVLAVPFWPILASGQVPFGLVYVLGAAISWALGTVYLKGHPVPVPPLASTTWQVIIAAVICAVCMALFETPYLDLTATPQLSAFIYHVLFPQGIAYLLWFDLAGRVSASTAALGTLLVPIFGVAGAVALLGDWPTPLDLAGLGFILCAVVLDQLRR